MEERPTQGSAEGGHNKDLARRLSTPQLITLFHSLKVPALKTRFFYNGKYINAHLLPTSPTLTLCFTRQSEVQLLEVTFSKRAAPWILERSIFMGPLHAYHLAFFKPSPTIKAIGTFTLGNQWLDYLYSEKHTNVEKLPSPKHTFQTC